MVQSDIHSGSWFITRIRLHKLFKSDIHQNLSLLDSICLTSGPSKHSCNLGGRFISYVGVNISISVERMKTGDVENATATPLYDITHKERSTPETLLLWQQQLSNQLVKTYALRPITKQIHLNTQTTQLVSRRLGNSRKLLRVKPFNHNISHWRGLRTSHQNLLKNFCNPLHLPETSRWLLKTS